MELKATRKASILLVDDKPANTLALESLLQTPERQIVKAQSGEEALKMVLQRPIDLIILDVQMPQMNGIEVAQILKLNKRTRDIPIIFATAEARDYQEVMKGYEEGAMDYLLKPLKPEIVQAKVSVLLKLQMQKKELQEKNEALARSALLIHNSADIIGVIDERTLRMEEVNHAFETILGYPESETRGMLLSFLLSNEDREKVKELAAQQQEQLLFETCVYCKDRTEKWLQWKVVAKGGKWFFNARDITEVKQTEQIRTFLATVVKQSNDAIYICDQEGHIISWNLGAERIYGYTEKEALRMHIWNIIPEVVLPEAGALVQKVMNGKKIRDMATRRVTRHGKIIDVRFSASKIVDPTTQQKTIAITERDVTLQNIAEEQIRKLNTDLERNIEQLKLSNRELESFSYSVSHDLRAPLRALNGYTRILEEDFGHLLEGEARDLLSKILFNAQRMGVLIDDLLAFSRLGRKPVEKKLISMDVLVAEVLKSLAGSTPHQAEIQTDILGSAAVDYMLLHQVWFNLLSNAVKYSSKKEKPQIQVGKQEKEDYIVFFVKDNGVGFNMDYADKLFGVFQRLHSPSEFEGTGVGLAIVQRIVSKHNGQVWAEGKINEGATFYFTIPKPEAHGA